MDREKWNALALVALVLVLAGFGPWLVHEVRSLPRPVALAARAHQRIVTLEVGGLTCSRCAAAVGKSLESVRGVAQVDVRYREHRAFVVCDRAVSDSTLRTAVHRAGPGFLAAVAGS